ncbi:hypothetical protein [Nonomuraea basaltis]|uniref:hypothetical protein n=1 Tax=Nonomuraea basaltis TaxID=2495887 RepID=UPI00110C621B|nr:hypothetical protein [Nonomuraea basaltis]TMR88614.1 hypothetical protein EJK15_65310 [Nonomuraea basaltis]
MASFACIAYVLERAADIMLGDFSLTPDQALIRAIWGDQPAPCGDCGEQERYQLAAHVVEVQYSHMIESDLVTYLSDIPRGSARSAAREMARLFRQVGGRAHLEGDDLDKVARLMWEQPHGVEPARCP